MLDPPQPAANTMSSPTVMATHRRTESKSTQRTAVSGLTWGAMLLHMGDVRRRVIVHGHVQGVWFREFTRRTAEAAGVRGWVRNLADGTVEAAFEGAAEAVEALVAWCHDGPPNATVTRVDVTDEPHEGLDRFAVWPTPPPV